MKRFLIAATLAAAAVTTTPVLAADVGVSVSIGQPGFYGRLDVGDYPPPQVIYRQPRYVEREAYGRQPIYLRVPPGHAKHWGKHCREYNACGERVYFVQDNWYQREYVPAYQKRHGEYHEDRRDERNDDRGDHDGGKHKDKRHGNKHDKGGDRH